MLDRAYILLLMGRSNEALSLIQKAHAMDPRTADSTDASYFSGVECLGNLASGNYREATPHCEQNGASGDSWRDQALLVALYSQQGEMAKGGYRESRRVNPKISY